jgi:DNA replication protein DnaC
MREQAKLPLLLKELKLSTIGRLWDSMAEEAGKEGWAHPRFLASLCEHEVEERYQKRISRYVKLSNLPAGKSLATFDFNHVPSVSKAKIQELASNSHWVSQGNNVLVFGPSGVGKTHLASAIGHALVEKGMRVLFTATTTLVQRLQLSRQNLSLPAALDKLDKYDLLILDDIGYVRKDDAETHVLFELIAHRYESKSLVVTSNQPFSEWDQIFATNSMTVAAIDRLVHHATILEVVTESYRRLHSLDKH